MGFSENLREIRRSKHMSQADLAKKIGVYRQTIIEWENPNGKRPEFDSLVWLVEALGVSWNRLMKGEEPKDKEAETDPNWERMAPAAKALLSFARAMDAVLDSTFEKKNKGEETNEQEQQS